MSNIKQDLIVIALVALGFFGTTIFRLPSDQLSEAQPKVLPPKFLNHMSFGFKLAIADSLWLRTLQHDDFCEVKSAKAAFNPGMLLEEALKAKLGPSRCHKGWVYHMLDMVTDLNPDFRWVYRLGGVMLSIGVDDREGARLIFEKGIAYDPTDWVTLYRAAYHYIFEIQDAVRARQVLSLASQNQEAPAIVSILAARLESAAGRTQIALDTLSDYLKTAKPGTESYNHAKFRYEELKKKAQLEADKPGTKKK
jgi:hypothetical protein